MKLFLLQYPRANVLQVQAEKDIKVPVEKLWKAITEPQLFRDCIPGCEEITKVGDELRAKIKSRVGFITATFDDVTIKEKNVEHMKRIDYEISGQEKKRIGGFKQNLSLIIEKNNGHSRLFVTSDIQANGKFASLGKRIFEYKAKDMINEFVRLLELKLGNLS